MRIGFYVACAVAATLVLTTGTLALTDSVKERIKAFQEYLRKHPTPEYATASQWVRDTCEDFGLSADIIELVAGKPTVICKIAGKQPHLSSVLFNSHMDVVPTVNASLWISDPYGAEIHDNKIIARGSQDMKCIGVMYLLALKKKLAEGWRPLRTVYVTFVSDEEIGGFDGMKVFVHSSYFKAMNVGFGMDEGVPSDTNELPFFFAERRRMVVKLIVRAGTCHGASLIKETAPVRLSKILAKVADRRLIVGLADEPEEVGDMEHGRGRALGVNIVHISAGIPSSESPTGFSKNVVPGYAEAGLDIRVPPAVAEAEVIAEIESWLACEGECADSSYELVENTGNSFESSMDEEASPFYKAFRESMKKLGIEVKPSIFPGGTDARYLREIGVQSIGFSPIPNTPLLLHKFNEFLDVDVFNSGIVVYETLIPHIADCEGFDNEKTEL